jgi:hypothetical protein
MLESREKGAANKRSERKERAKEKVFGMVVVVVDGDSDEMSSYKVFPAIYAFSPAQTQPITTQIST